MPVDGAVPASRSSSPSSFGISSTRVKRMRLVATAITFPVAVPRVASAMHFYTCACEGISERVRTITLAINEVGAERGDMLALINAPAQLDERRRRLQSLRTSVSLRDRHQRAHTISL